MTAKDRVTSGNNPGYNDDVMEPSTSGIENLKERLLAFSRPDGGLPYYRGGLSSTEPTLLAALALFAIGVPVERATPLLSWAQALQNTDGSISVDLGHRGQGLWMTAHAAIVFHHYGFRENLKRAQDFLLSLKSVTILNDPRIRQDNTLAGWPWVLGPSDGWNRRLGLSSLSIFRDGPGTLGRSKAGSSSWTAVSPPAGGITATRVWTIRNCSPSGTRPGSHSRPSAVKSTSTEFVRASTW